MFRVSYSDRYEVDLPSNHRFPMIKYQLIREQLCYEGILEKNQLFEPDMISDEIVLLTHTEEYWHRIKNLQLTDREIRKIGFPQSKQHVLRTLNSVSGTLYSALNALRDGIGMNIAGGTHHAYADHGEGFCFLNDVAIASNYLLQQNLAKKILIVDLDVHQGNGSAVIFKDNPGVFTFSVHCKDNYPLKKEISDLDISMPAFIGDDEFLKVVKEQFISILDTVNPDFIFYIAGVDILFTDKLGKFQVTQAGCKKRDEIILKSSFTKKIPLTVVMGGGYSEKYTDIISAHVNTFKIANDLWG